MRSATILDLAASAGLAAMRLIPRYAGHEGIEAQSRKRAGSNRFAWLQEHEQRVPHAGRIDNQIYSENINSEKNLFTYPSFGLRFLSLNSGHSCAGLVDLPHLGVQMASSTRS